MGLYFRLRFAVYLLYRCVCSVVDLEGKEREKVERKKITKENLKKDLTVNLVYTLYC